ADGAADDVRGPAEDAQRGEERPAWAVLVPGEGRDDAEALGCVVEAEADDEGEGKTELRRRRGLPARQDLRAVVESDPGGDEDREPTRGGHRHDVLLGLILGDRRCA